LTGAYFDDVVFLVGIDGAGDGRDDALIG